MGIALVACAGCYAAHAPPGAPCTADGLCPAQLMCVDDVCVENVSDGAVANAPWTLVQTKDAQSTTTVSLAATGAGNLIVVGVQVSIIGSISAITDDTGNTYVSANARANDISGTASVEVWYAADAKAAATTITVSSGSVSSVDVWEVANVRTAAPVDAIATANNQASSTMPLGASITTTTAGDFVVSIAIVAHGVSGIHGGNAFTNDHSTKGNGFAHLTSNTAPAGTYQAAWDQPSSGTWCSSSVAFFGN